MNANDARRATAIARAATMTRARAHARMSDDDRHFTTRGDNLSTTRIMPVAEVKVRARDDGTHCMRAIDRVARGRARRDGAPARAG